MKRILSVVGARPNFMKVAPIHRAFHAYADSAVHEIVHTGQHYDAAMSDAFFTDLQMPAPAYFLGVGSGTHAEQTAKVMVAFEKIIDENRPDLVIVVGDVNSTIAAALPTVKAGVPLAHVEAGLRSFDRAMPEEINRLATDAIADHLFVTEQSGLTNLLREGHDPRRVHMVGNTMIDSLHYALPVAEQSDIHARIGVEQGRYVVATLHRPSNVDHHEQLAMLLQVMADMAATMPVVFPVHPRTRRKIDEGGLAALLPDTVILIDPVGYVEFLALLRFAACVVTDSGGIQEETTALRVPCITARTTTERPVTVEIGTNMLVAPSHEALIDAFRAVARGDVREGRVPELWDGKAAERIAHIVMKDILA